MAKIILLNLDTHRNEIPAWFAAVVPLYIYTCYSLKFTRAATFKFYHLPVQLYKKNQIRNFKSTFVRKIRNNRTKKVNKVYKINVPNSTNGDDLKLSINDFKIKS